MTDWGNRIFLGLFSLTLIALGVTGLLARNGSLQLAQPTVGFERLVELANDQPNWWVVALIGAGLVLLGVGLAILRQQLRWSRLPKGSALQHAADNPETGTTTVLPSAMEKAVHLRLCRLASVDAAKVRLLQGGRKQRYLARLDVSPQIDLSALVTQLHELSQQVAIDLAVDSVAIDARLRVEPDAATRVV